MEDSLHDTIDLKDEVEELDDIDEILAAGPVAVAAEARHTSVIEVTLMTVANGIWAVVGLVLWLPQVTRAVLGAALRTVHAAMTHQSSARAAAGIQRVSRSYVERFLRRQRDPQWVGRRHELRPFRLIGEVVWTVFFYLVVLRWIAPDRFAPVWARLKEWWGSARGTAATAWESGKGWLTPDLASLDVTPLQVAGVLLLAIFLGLLLGVWLGRRGR